MRDTGHPTSALGRASWAIDIARLLSMYIHVPIAATIFLDKFILALL